MASPNQPNELDRTNYKYKKSTIINKNSDKPKSDKVRHYVDGVAFYEALKERRELREKALANGTPVPQITNFIGECIMKIANNLSRKYQFANYPFRDDMVADAILHCVRYIDSFDPSKTSNPFSYFTQAIYYRFLDKIRREQLQTYVKCKSTLNSVVMSDLSSFEGELSDMAEHIHDNLEFDTEFMEKYVDDFERKMSKAKTTKVKGLGLLYEEDAE